MVESGVESESIACLAGHGGGGGGLPHRHVDQPVGQDAPQERLRYMKTGTILLCAEALTHRWVLDSATVQRLEWDAPYKRLRYRFRHFHFCPKAPEHRWVIDPADV